MYFKIIKLKCSKKIKEFLFAIILQHSNDNVFTKYPSVPFSLNFSIRIDCTYLLYVFRHRFSGENSTQVLKFYTK